MSYQLTNPQYNQAAGANAGAARGYGQPLYGQIGGGGINTGYQPLNNQPQGYGAPAMMGPAQASPGGLYGMNTAMMNLPQILTSINTGVFVKQKLNLLTTLTGCQGNNMYVVYEQNDRGGAGPQQLFVCQEDSSWFSRNCLNAACKPYHVEVLKNSVSQEPGVGQRVLLLQRDCALTCCCINRPELKVFYTETGPQAYLGKVVDDFACCSYNYKVYDAQDQLRYIIDAECCQLGLCCRCPCDSCQKVEFKLWQGDRQRELPPIFKLGKSSFLRNVVGQNDNFSIPYVEGMSWQDKALLMSAALIIDYSMFEEQPADRERRRNHHHNDW